MTSDIVDGARTTHLPQQVTPDLMQAAANSHLHRDKLGEACCSHFPVLRCQIESTLPAEDYGGA